MDSDTVSRDLLVVTCKQESHMIALRALGGACAIHAGGETTGTLHLQYYARYLQARKRAGTTRSGSGKKVVQHL